MLQLSKLYNTFRYSNAGSIRSNTYIQKNHIVNMSTIKEYPEEYGWWVNELDSLGIKEEKRDDKSNKQQLKDFAENIKQRLYKEYKS